MNKPFKDRWSKVPRFEESLRRNVSLRELELKKKAIEKMEKRLHSVYGLTDGQIFRWGLLALFLILYGIGLISTLGESVPPPFVNQTEQMLVEMLLVVLYGAVWWFAYSKFIEKRDKAMLDGEIKLEEMKKELSQMEGS